MEKQTFLMEISDLLSPTDVMIDVSASDKSRLLRRLSGLAASALGLDPNHVSEQIAKREKLGSTGVGNGVALPHARLTGLKAPFGLLVYAMRSTSRRSTTAGRHCVFGPPA